MQTVTVPNPPTGVDVFFIVNGKVYVANESAGVFWVQGTTTVSWDETVTGYLLSNSDEIIVK